MKWLRPHVQLSKKHIPKRIGCPHQRRKNMSQRCNIYPSKDSKWIDPKLFLKLGNENLLDLLQGGYVGLQGEPSQQAMYRISQEWMTSNRCMQI
jgi:hypothetical protein